MTKKAGPKLRDPVTWLPSAAGVISRNLGPIFFYHHLLSKLPFVCAIVVDYSTNQTLCQRSRKSRGVTLVRKECAKSVHSYYLPQFQTQLS